MLPMPELPEVETVARGLQRVVGRRIVGVDVRWERTVAAPDVGAFVERLRGRRILGVGRRGKWLILSLDGGEYLLVHLGMSGNLVHEPTGAQDDPYTRVLVTLGDGGRLAFSDPRKFGRMAVVADPQVALSHLGPEPLVADFTAERLEQMLSGRRGRLKPLLLDQRFLAGLGNIYTDEALWRARIHPLRRASDLDREEVTRLHRAIREVLAEAIAAEGTTLDDARYVGPDGRPGGFALRLMAYGQAGQPCARCGTMIKRIVVGGRGTHLCATCQPECSAGGGTVR